MVKVSVDLQKTYYQLLIEFLRESAIHGLKVFLTNSPLRYAKLLWLIFLTSVIIITHTIIINLIFNYLDQPTEVHMSTQMVHISNSPFPAVGICSTNKFSRKKVLQFAEQVYQAQQSLKPGLLAQSAKEMSQHLLLFGGFFMHPFDDFEDSDPRLQKLHQILTYMYNDNEYPVREILYALSPDCEELIVRGMIFGQRVANVSKYFSKRITSAGACCMFNYRRGSYAEEPKVRALRDELVKAVQNITFEANSILNSVQFVLQNDPEDFTYTEFDSYAFQLYIFPQDEYPVISTNTMGEILVDHNSVMEVAVQPTFYGSSHSTYSFSPTVRKCYFDVEGQHFLNKSYYSLDECLLICLMNHMNRHCGCVRAPLAGVMINASYCNLLQLPCLTQWKRVFNDMSYFGYLGETLDMPPHASDFDTCTNCMPTCQGIEYEIDTNQVPLREATTDGVYSYGLVKGLASTKPLAIVQLYFKQRLAESTRMDIVSDWVELLNRFGGILSLFYGFSIISYIEILYFGSGKWFLLFHRRWQQQRHQHDQTVEISNDTKRKGRVKVAAPATVKGQQLMQNLYWHELQPKNAKLNSLARHLKKPKNDRY